MHGVVYVVIFEIGKFNQRNLANLLISINPLGLFMQAICRVMKRKL
jgi:hypothetical protein